MLNKISISNHPDIYSDCNPAYLAAWIEMMKKTDRSKLGLANGCFDLFHAGHRQLLEMARIFCDGLVVVINSDESVRRLKGPGRPVWPITKRVAAVRPYADWVCIFHGDTPEALIRAVRPAVLFKGKDSGPVEKIPGAAWVMANGGRVELLPYLVGYSTTGILAAGGVE